MDIMRMGKNPNFLGSWDLDDIPGRVLTLTIADISDEEVVSNGKTEVCTVCRFAEDYKPMILNITNKKRIAKLYKTKQTEKLIGRRVSITTERVKAFGDIYDALRIVQKLPPDKVSEKIVCENCGSELAPVGRLTPAELAKYTRAKYGRCLCSACATACANATTVAGEDKKEDVQNETA